MEECERPSKVRKLSHDRQASVYHDTEIVNPIPLPSSSDCIASVPQTRNPNVKMDMSITSTPVEAKRSKNDEISIKHGTMEKAEGDPQSDHEAKLPAPEHTAPMVISAVQSTETPPLSKSQQKKLRKKAEWESKREERKVVRKEKQVAKRERKRVAKRQQLEEAPAETGEKLPPPKAVQLPITIAIDCDFDDLMRDNERISLAAQITRCYSDNKNSLFRAHLTICSFGGKLKERFDNVLTHYKSWRGVRALECDFVETAEKAQEWMAEEETGGQLAGVFSKYVELDEAAQAELKTTGEVVYLSSEADEDLTELKPYSTYIIGGLVDKNREKGVCYKRATKRGVRTARLPIGEYMDMQSRKVLATNHVNEIMVKWLECGDWGDAFMKVIPKRKGGKLRDANQDEKTSTDNAACKDASVDDSTSEDEKS